MKQPEDNRVCEGNYDSAMHYDCDCCLARCSYRKEKLTIIDCAIILCMFAIVIGTILKIVGAF